ncbi:MAG: hypothetical protein K6B75_03215 [Lachnospiraceae bacterium]|nr:hypothetical protein [Lachnospiraceae bacterium]
MYHIEVTIDDSESLADEQYVFDSENTNDAHYQVYEMISKHFSTDEAIETSLWLKHAKAGDTYEGDGFTVSVK